ncbi:lipoyl protein ligase domain-containing protein [Aeromicrobium endophyticum]|uniref:lipoyl protein ligase domain-containing protein n=1 Tax=Aeromicrobium endophyticum TaxID=2292704 RepID=UPI000E6B37D5|nr:lipoate--protein ligase family protein [Aeromicrobium endophyticum]
MPRDDASLLVTGHPDDAVRSAAADLAVPAVQLRADGAPWSELVHVYVAHGPTVAFTRRDLRSPGIVRATAVARAAGFETAVRSPGGRMVAYDAGAVIVDHLTRAADRHGTFERNAQQHAAVIRSLGDVDARVGEVEGEYCPGEFSVNVGGRVKVVGSAQRITGTGALFSTVVQVVVGDRVRQVIADVSAALGYELEESTIAGIADVAPHVTTQQVADALAADYRRVLGTADAELDPHVLAHAAAAARVPRDDLPLDVDAWARAHPLT